MVIVGGALLSDKFGRRVIVLTACVLCWVGLMVIGGLGLVPLNDKVGGVLVSYPPLCGRDLLADRSIASHPDLVRLCLERWFNFAW